MKKLMLAVTAACVAVGAFAATLTSSCLKNTNTVIHCSKYAPGWKALRMTGWASCPEWDARPEGCFGI